MDDIADVESIESLVDRLKELCEEGKSDNLTLDALENIIKLFPPKKTTRRCCHTAFIFFS